MTASLSERVYAQSPTWLQHGLVSAFGWRWRRIRLEGEWPAFVREFRARERFTAEGWRAFSTRRLREVLTTAIERTPHFAQEWRSLGFTRDSLARFEIEDLARLPILSKDVVRRAPASILVDGVPHAGARVYHTSGSTGTPIATYSTPREMQRSMALREARSAGWAGVSFLQPRATFSGRMVVPPARTRGPYYRYNIFERQVYFSAFHLGPDTVVDYVAALHRHRPRWLTGYAHAFQTLARLAREQGLACPPLDAVVTTSEKVTPTMRDTMQDVYGCRVYEEYGSIEDAMYACECEQGGLHVSPDAGIVEILDEHGQPAPAGQPGRVVVTGFLRKRQLFIRFALGDEAAWAGRPCACGRDMPLLETVTGRIEDVVIGPDGRRVGQFYGVFVDQPNVVEGQIVQETLHDITVNVVGTADFGRDDVEEIRRRLHARLSDAVRVQVVPVKSIPRTAAGKFQAVVSKVRTGAAPERP